MEPVIIIRPVRLQDLDKLAVLEKKAWQRRETEILSETSLRKWYEERSPFFIVAELNQEICGYYFARQVHFNPTDTDKFLEQFDSDDSLPPNPEGRSVYAQSVVATTPGAGTALHHAIHELFKIYGIEYFIGFSRMPMFSRFAKRIKESEVGSRYSLDTLALWYAHESLERLGMEAWPQCTAKPKLSLPPLRKPDPVIAFHGKAIKMSLLRVMPNYMQDPESLNYGALLASRIT